MPRDPQDYAVWLIDDKGPKVPGLAPRAKRWGFPIADPAPHCESARNAKVGGSTAKASGSIAEASGSIAEASGSIAEALGRGREW